MPRDVSMVPEAGNSSLPASDSAALDRFASAVLRVQTVAKHADRSPARTFEYHLNGNAEESDLAEAIKESNNASGLSAPSAANPLEEVKAVSASNTAVAQ